MKISNLSSQQESFLTKKIIFKILRNANLKLQTAILLVLSSGLCLGELVQLRLSDIDFTNTPTKILVRNTKNGLPREVFITEEATNSLKEYLRRHFGWHPNSLNLDISHVYIFGKTLKNKSDDFFRLDPISARQSIQKSLKNHIKNIPDLNLTHDNRNNLDFHEFRRFFKTTVTKVCGIDFAGALCGYSSYMDWFYHISKEEKNQKYLSAEPYLTISDFEILERQFNEFTERLVAIESSISNLYKNLISNRIVITELLRSKK